MNDASIPSVIPQARFEASHIGASSPLPYIDLGDGSAIQLLQVDLRSGLWISRVKFQPGCTIDSHYHTGSVYAVTLAGHWYYREYPESVNGPGSYLFEPAGSVHTLTVDVDADEAAHVWFAVQGANVNIGADGNVSSIVDAATVLQAYRDLAGEAELSDLLVVQ